MFTTFEKIINTLYEFANMTDAIGFIALNSNNIDVQYDPECPTIEGNVLINELFTIFETLDPEYDGCRYIVDGIEVTIHPYGT